MLPIIFWLLIALVLYTYVGYGVVVTLLTRRFTRAVMRDRDVRRVTLLIAAYNEEDVIAAKIENSLALDYPRDMLQIIVVTDGSSDRTPEIVATFAGNNVICLHSPERRGKLAALKRVLPSTDGEIVVFSDANAFYNRAALRRLVAPFADSQVGAVCGEKRVRGHSADGEQPSGEGLYWRYESHLKKMDSRLYSVVGAAGEVYAVRRECLEMPPDNTLLDDFMISMLVTAKGYRVIYEPEAIAHEIEAPNIGDEFERRARNGCGGFQAIWWLRRLLIPRSGWLWFQYVSHRVMRWAVAPLALLLLIPVNVALIGAPLYRVLLGLQILFYLLSVAGLATASRGWRVKALFVPAYFVMMNAAALVGLYRYIARSQHVTWKKIAHTAVQPE